MSKSALIVNTPRDCEQCKGLMQIDEHSLPVCIYANRLKFYKDRPKWCPLVEIPEEVEKMIIN